MNHTTRSIMPNTRAAQYIAVRYNKILHTIQSIRMVGPGTHERQRYLTLTGELCVSFVSHLSKIDSKALGSYWSIRAETTLSEKQIMSCSFYLRCILQTYATTKYSRYLLRLWHDLITIYCLQTFTFDFCSMRLYFTTILNVFFFSMYTGCHN